MAYYAAILNGNESKKFIGGKGSALLYIGVGWGREGHLAGLGFFPGILSFSRINLHSK